MHSSLVEKNVCKQGKWLFNPSCNVFVLNYLNLLFLVAHIKILILKEIGQKEINTYSFSLLISLNYKKLLSFMAKKKKR